MVAVATPNVQLSANMEPADHRRRKQTIERAKANHLSRQLQMRLQYAKLKVEHGWQRQNLTEVENLYFHHSGRIGRPAGPPPPKVITIPPADQPTFPSSFNFTSDQFPSASSHPKSPTPPVSQPSVSSDSVRIPTPQPPSSAQSNTPNPLPDQPTRRSGSPSQSATQPAIGLRTPTPPTTTTSVLQPPPSVSKLPSTSIPSSTYQAVTNSHTGSSAGTSGSGGNGSSSLTYDSFWSSHSLSNMALAYRVRSTTSPHGSVSSLPANGTTTSSGTPVSAGVDTPSTNGGSTVPPKMGAYGAPPAAQHVPMYAAPGADTGVMMGMGYAGYAPAAFSVQSSGQPAS